MLGNTFEVTQVSLIRSIGQSPEPVNVQQAPDSNSVGYRPQCQGMASERRQEPERASDEDAAQGLGRPLTKTLTSSGGTDFRVPRDRTGFLVRRGFIASYSSTRHCGDTAG